MLCTYSLQREDKCKMAGVVYARTAEQDDGSFHTTIVYSDNYRYSRDEDDDGWSNEHWTNQSVSKGSSSRHQAPDDEDDR